MKPYFEDNLVWWYNKDCRDMSELRDNSVQCVVTSPPYWGLRKYSGLPDLVWGDNSCEHEWGKAETREMNYVQGNPEFARPHREHKNFTATTNTCSLCGAWKGSYGLEPTPEMYIEHTIEILREIKRVLRSDGVVFWNIGDSYWGGGQGGDIWGGAKEIIGTEEYGHTAKGKHPTLKSKDLCLIPFRIAIAAQEDGWWVRSVIIWSKPNPMPESVTDRPTESHEYILMLTKSGTTQYWTHRDGGGTRQKPKADYRWVNQLTNEEVAIEPPDWKAKIICPECEGEGEVEVYLGLDVWQTMKCPTCNGKKETQLWKRINLWRGHDYYWDADAVREPHKEASLARDELGYNAAFKGRHTMPGENRPHSTDHEGFCNPAGRNIRTVWEFPTQPYPEAHFAVFPEKLPELCIKAATPEVGCCSKCGAPWERVIEKTTKEYNPSTTYTCETEWVHHGEGKSTLHTEKDNVTRETLGWHPTCKCNTDKVPSVVLDPFMGSGTALWVAKNLGRQAVGYELSEEYCALALERNRQSVMELKV